MKKAPAKKLLLNRTTLAVIASRDLTKAVGGALPEPFTKASACADQCCVTDWCW